MYNTAESIFTYLAPVPETPYSIYLAPVPVTPHLQGMSTIINGGASTYIEMVRFRTDTEMFRAVCVLIERRMETFTDYIFYK